MAINFAKMPQAMSEAGETYFVWYSIEIVINAATIVNGIIMNFAFIKLKMLHPYFRTVCFNVFAVGILRSVVRILILSLVISGKSKKFQPLMEYLFVAVHFINITLDFAQINVVIERVWSSIRYKVYESKKNPTVMAAFVLLPLIGNVIVHVLLFSLKWLPLIVFSWANLMLNVFIWAWFYWFLQYLTKKSAVGPQSWTLSVRYQQTENLRVCVTMKWFGWYCSIQSWFVSSFTLWVFFDPRTRYSNISHENGSIFLTSDVICDFIFSISTALYPIPFIATMESVRRQYFRTFCFKTPTRSNSVINRSFINKNSNTDHYFEQLKLQWDAHPPTKQK